jgi:hypothetical protein
MDHHERRLSSSIHHPRQAPVRPELDEVPTRPAVYDSRYLAWRIHNPSHPQYHDPDLVNHNREPRQQRLDTCNILQLYHHLEYYFARYQIGYTRLEKGGKVIFMQQAMLEPQPGWRLFDETTNLEYEVRAALQSMDVDGKKTFNGNILLTAAAPENGHKLVWVDPYGEVDGQPKLIRLIHQEEVMPLLEARSPSANAEMADVRSKPFTPVIGYTMIRHEPGSLGKHPFGPNREMKLRIRMIAKDPYDPNVYQRIKGWWMDTLVQFQAYAIGGKTADRISVWLRNFFKVYTSALKLLGVQEVLYWTTNRDREESRTAYDLSVRNVQFYFRLEEIEVELTTAISAVNIAYEVTDTLYDVDHELCYGDSYNYFKPLFSPRVRI